jgi:hypothetical protein
MGLQLHPAMKQHGVGKHVLQPTLSNAVQQASKLPKQSEPSNLCTI